MESLPAGPRAGRPRRPERHPRHRGRRAWLLVARRDVRGAAIGALVLAGVTLAWLPFTGIGLWVDWPRQAARASDPNWVSIGWPLSRYLPTWVALAVTAATLPASLLLPRRDAAAWVGLLIVIGAPSVHAYMWVFCLPAMLRIRREIALIAAIGFSVYRPDFGWASLALVATVLLASYQWPALAAPGAGRSVTESADS